MTKRAQDQGDEEKTRSEYQQHMTLLEELITGQTTSLEKALLTLSAGAFGLSIAFVTQLVPEPEQPEAMVVAWSAFGLALILTVFSFYASIKALVREREIAPALFYPDSVPPLPNKKRRGRKKRRGSKTSGNVEGADYTNRWGAAVGLLNFFAALSFAVGVVALGYFATINVV